MALLIKDGTLAADPWQKILTADELEAVATSKSQCLLLALPLWLEHGLSLAHQGHAVAVWLGPDDELAPLIPALDTLPLIAIHFPAFTDGRGYSLAKMLRRRYGFGGELRATGDILRDQIYLLYRCGFSSFSLRDDQNPQEAIAALEDYSWSPVVGR